MTSFYVPTRTRLIATKGHGAGAPLDVTADYGSPYVTTDAEEMRLIREQFAGSLQERGGRPSLVNSTPVNLAYNPTAGLGTTGATVGAGALARSAADGATSNFTSFQNTLSVAASAWSIFGGGMTGIGTGTAGCAVVPGLPYFYSAAAKTVSVSTGVPGTLFLSVRFYDSTGTQVGSDTTVATQTAPALDTWYTLSGNLTTPATAVFAIIRMVGNLSTATAVGRVSALQITQSAGSVPYADGTYGGAYWTGTAHLSSTMLYDWANEFTNPSGAAGVTTGWSPRGGTTMSVGGAAASPPPVLGMNTTQNVMDTTPGLVARWPLNEPVGTSFSADAGGFTGTWGASGVTLAQAPLTKFGRSVALSGVAGASGSIPYSAALNSPVFSVECWAVASVVPTITHGVLAFRTGTGTQGGWLLYQNSAGRWTAQIINSAGASVAINPPSSSAIVAGATVHLLMTYDGATLTLYINGANAGAVVSDYLPPPGTATFRVGVVTTATELVGSLSEVAYYNRALTSDEAAARYAARNSGSALRNTNTSQTSSYINRASTMGVGPGQAISFGGWYLSDYIPSISAPSGIQLQGYYGSGATAAPSTVQATPSATKWVQLKIENATVPASDHYINPRYGFQNTPNSGDGGWVTGTQFNTGATLLPYFEGSYPNCSWEGADALTAAYRLV